MSSGQLQLNKIDPQCGRAEHKYLCELYQIIGGTKNNCINYHFTNHKLILDTLNFIDFNGLSGVARRGLVDKLRELKVTVVESPKNESSPDAKRVFEGKIETLMKAILKEEKQTAPKGIVNGKIEILTASELMDELEFVLTELKEKKFDFTYYNLVLDVVEQDRLIEMFHWVIFLKKLQSIVIQSKGMSSKVSGRHQQFNERLGDIIAHFQTEKLYRYIF